MRMATVIEREKHSKQIKQAWLDGKYKNRNQIYRTLEWKKKVGETVKQRWQEGIYGNERNRKISIAHKNKLKPWLYKDYIKKCLCCNKEFTRKLKNRLFCSHSCANKTVPRKYNPIIEKQRRIKISNANKGKIPKNLFSNIRMNNSYKQLEMFEILKQYYPSAKLNHFVKIGKRGRFLDVAIPELMLDYEYNGKVHLMKNVQINDEKRTKELQKIGWKIINIDRTNFNNLHIIIKENGDVF